jgi:hypothetical protein
MAIQIFRSGLYFLGQDELDARDLADLRPMGRLPGAWIGPAEIREPREITRYRRKPDLCCLPQSPGDSAADALTSPLPRRIVDANNVTGADAFLRAQLTVSKACRRRREDLHFQA